MQISKTNCVQLAAQLLPGAVKELSAFAPAVEEQFGREQVRCALEHWLEALESKSWQASGEIPDWRALTVAAATRLANRVSVSRLEETVACSDSESVAFV